MGRTVATFHQLIEQAQARFAPYRRALRREDQRVFDELFALVKYHAAAGSMSVAWNPLDAIFLSLFLEQQKSICVLRERLEALESQHATHGLAAGSLSSGGGNGPVGD